MPLVARLALVVAVAALALVVVTTVTGVLPRFVASFGTALGGITDTFLRTPVPSETLALIPPPPALASPENPYTNKPTVTLAGTVPLEVVGRGGILVRIYVAVPDQDPVAVRDLPIGETTSFVVEELPLEPGRNDVTATLVGPGGESEPSPVITYVLDRSKPKITVSSPKNGATVNGPSAKIVGKTQGRSTVVGAKRNRGDHQAASDGTFTLQVPIRGTNGSPHGHGSPATWPPCSPFGVDPATSTSRCRRPPIASAPPASRARSSCGPWSPIRTAGRWPARPSPSRSRSRASPPSPART
jgi:hypothetical protein